MGKAEKFRDKAQQAAEQAKAKAAQTREQIAGRSDESDVRRRAQEQQERTEQAMRDAGTDRA
ncbi:MULTISPECIES: hypothetical protein [Streptomyces]|uniref:CsbD family protein n=1 Tax=Streptomyces xanthochromogenes TaxID=67384 RepID=A0ABQ2ZKT1_9ACTN|nr:MULTISPECIES: hypothetical protein [Streptomyces]MYV91062.1 hypothetical protein [Streptomyces sp. SID1034]GGY19046.1 hypothetical protein GCM10010326_09870 [Streptomyces xanthochromogenes]